MPRSRSHARDPISGYFCHSEPSLLSHSRRAFRETCRFGDPIRSSSGELQQAHSSELLAKILAAPPDFFERLVVQLLVAICFGGSAHQAERAVGKSGDGGVDGAIDQDTLGLDRIYVQAKGYAESKVSSAEVRDFFGYLDRPLQGEQRAIRNYILVLPPQ